MDGANPSSTPDDEGWVVLAEETWLRWLNWEYPTETRVGVRLERNLWASLELDNHEERLDQDDMDGGISAGLALDGQVEAFSHLRAEEYLTRASAPYSIVVRNSTFRFETPANSWLAINPVLAEYLGWHPAPEGLFRWVDAGGNVMAESLWWQDGFAQQRPPLFDDEVGHGWLVRVSARAWEQMEPVVGACVDWCRVARIARDQPLREVVGCHPVGT